MQQQDPKTAAIALSFYSDMTMMSFIQTMNAALDGVTLKSVKLTFQNDNPAVQPQVTTYNAEGRREV